MPARRRIAVAIAGGGIDRIEVTDDGSGMTADELALCGAAPRHLQTRPTTTIWCASPRWGFAARRCPASARRRGSPSPPARRARTRRPPSASRAARSARRRPSAGAPGTRVVVRDLFFATPARRKFLKSPRAEADAAEAAVRRLALAAPACGHAASRATGGWRSTCRPGPRRPGGRAARRRGGGGAAAGGGGAQGAARLTGYAAAPAVTRATAAAQALVVNGRPVADPVLRTAVRVAYRDVIAAGPPSGGGAVPRPAARGAGRERPPGQGRGAFPRCRRGAGAGDRPRSAGRWPAGAGRHRRRMPPRRRRCRARRPAACAVAARPPPAWPRPACPSAPRRRGAAARPLPRRRSRARDADAIPARRAGGAGARHLHPGGRRRWRRWFWWTSTPRMSG